MTATIRMNGSERMLAACQRQPVDATPVWFMRQAGRCFPEYRNLREKYDTLTIAKTPERSAQGALMPVQRLDVDAAVMFADIMMPLEGMGVPFHIEPEIGPIIPNPIRTDADVDRIQVIDAEEATPYIISSRWSWVRAGGLDDKRGIQQSHTGAREDGADLALARP